MGRKKRIWVPDAFYHIICRGNRRDALFMDDGDFRIMLHILNKVNEQTPFELAAYCLMTNHFHLMMRSEHQSISKVMSLINKRYADYYNTKNNLSGHVFEKRYYDKIILSETSMLKVSRYIHLNPLEAGMVRHPDEYPWSSYRHYVYRTWGHNLKMEEILDCFPGTTWEKRVQYQKFVEEVQEEELAVK